MESTGYETNWYVITGAPSSGKTAVICELEKRGYRVVHEVARAYIEEELTKGRKLDEIRADVRTFEQHILDRKFDIESSLPKAAVIFFDRAIPDSIAYFKLAGLDPAICLEKSKIVRYKKVFLFERLVFKTDHVRAEDDAIAAKLEYLLEDSYREVLGYKMFRVPPISVKARTELILKWL